MGKSVILCALSAHTLHVVVGCMKGGESGSKDGGKGERRSLRQRFDISDEDAAIKRASYHLLIELEQALRLSLEVAAREEERRKEEDSEEEEEEEEDEEVVEKKSPVKRKVSPKRKEKNVTPAKKAKQEPVKKEEKKVEEKKKTPLPSPALPKEEKKEEKKVEKKEEPKKEVKKTPPAKKPVEKKTEPNKKTPLPSPALPKDEKKREEKKSPVIKKESKKPEPSPRGGRRGEATDFIKLLATAKRMPRSSKVSPSPSTFPSNHPTPSAPMPPPSSFHSPSPSPPPSPSFCSTLCPSLNILLIIIVFITSLFLFQSGFLLKRVQLHDKSTCSDVSLSPSSCWLPRSFDRVVLVVIDALRHDFVQSERGEKEGGKQWMGQMPYTRDLVKKGAFLSKALADPPTTTLQRLKALGTGGLPTFIDASDNFNSDAAVEEDNLLAQLVASGRNATLLGDETWLSLYPTGFHRTFAKESFDIHDLHTVDNYILEHLSSELARPDWSLLVAHFLGVDHAGHKHGPEHIEMGAKLRQMDRVIKDVVSSLSPSDLLIVMGDHGMTGTGDHGGDSDDEVGAAFLAYSPSHSFPPHSPSSPPLQQIDLLPTLSLLLDLPIPFSSLGSPIESLFPEEKTRRMAVRLTAIQVDRFVSTYQRVTGGGLGFKLPEEVPDSLSEQRSLLAALQSSLRSQWTRFSIPLMRISLIVMADAVGALFSPPTIPSLVIRHSYLLLLLTLHFSPSPESSPALSILHLSTPLSIAYSAIHLVYRITSTVSLSSSSLFPASLLLVSFLIPFSNSFIISESSILLFFLSSILLYSFYITLSSSPSRSPSLSSLSSLPLLLFSLFLLRLHPLFHRCREEERDCLQYPFPLPFSSLPFDTRINRYLVSLVSSSFLYYFFRPSRPSPSSLLSLSSSLLLPSLLLTQLYFSSSLLPDSLSLQYSFHFRCIAQLVYVLSTVSLVLSLVSPFSDPLVPPTLLRSIALPLYLILGEGLALPFVSLLFLLYRTPSLIPSRSITVIYLSLLIPYAFYYLGHSPTLSSIPWHAAFTGISGSSAPRWLAAVLVFAHLFAPSLLLPPLLPSLGHSLTPLRMITAQALTRVCLSSAAVMMHRRHLMVWKIFAPHWIFSSLSLLVLLLSLSLSILLKRKIQLN